MTKGNFELTGAIDQLDQLELIGTKGNFELTMAIDHLELPGKKSNLQNRDTR